MNIEKLTKELTPISLELNLLSKASNDKFDLLEAILKKLNLGVPGSVEFTVPGNEKILPFALHYMRYEGTWGLYINAAGAVKHIKDAPRDLRIASVPLIPTLFENLQKEAMLRISQINKDIETIHNLLGI